MLNQNKTGFSLTELMITLVIFTFLIAALYAVLTTGKASWQIGNAAIDVQQELRHSIDWIAEELRQSGSLAISNVPTDGNWRNTISFRLPAGISNGNLVWATQQIQYSLGGLDGRQLLRTSAGQQRVLANNIISFQIRRQAARRNIVEIALQAEKINALGSIVSTDLSFQIILRN